MIRVHGTKTESSDRYIPMSSSLRETLERLLKEEPIPPGKTDKILKIDSAKKSIASACRRLKLPKFTHHDFRHFFATTCIESGVDIPTISRWLGHNDGGALAMRTYGHLQIEHSLAMIKRVDFKAKEPNEKKVNAFSQEARSPEPKPASDSLTVASEPDKKTIA